ncbi:MAG TPA: condensation domain-containing protein, partial [Longimicrobiaceae bacterium]|nr:condensation domain-containing protein [Longimicrobiaceae bacterium]
MVNSTVADRGDPEVEEKRRLLAEKLQDRARRENAFPLSFAQQRLWFVHQLDPSSPAYHMAAALRVRGALDPAVLRRVLDEVVRRHESLRTTFGTISGRTLQVVGEPAPAALREVDLRLIRASRREAELQALVAGEALRPFDLAVGPLLRTTAVRLGEDSWALLLTMHHIVSDGWSMGVLVREVSALYQAFSEGRESPLAPLRVQYPEYALWQRKLLRGETLQAQLGWWREQLAGAPPLLELPLDRPRSQVPDPGGRSLSVELQPDTSRALRALSQREGSTLFMTLLAAWQLLLGRYAGQEDVVVGMPIAGRTRAEVEGLIGFFVNTLVLRADLSGDPTFRELLGRVREATLGA